MAILVTLWIKAEAQIHLNRREHIYTLHLTLRSDACNIFSRNVSAKVSVELLAKFRRTLPPTFLFLLYAIFKEPAMTQSHRPQYRPANPAKQTQPSGQAQKPSGLHKTGKTEKNVTSATIPKALKDRLPQHSCLANLRAHSATASGAPPSL